MTSNLRIIASGLSCLAVGLLFPTGSFATITISDPPQGEFALSGGSGGGLSGIAHESGNQFFIVEDSGGRMYSATIDLDLNTGEILTATMGSSIALTGGVDLEGIAYDPSTGEVIVSDESGPALRRHATTGGVGTSILVPTVYGNHRSNLSLESVSRQTDGTIWIVNEEALMIDGPRSTTTAGTAVRIGNLASGQQWAYVTDSIRSVFFPSPGEERSGVSAILALPDETVLVLERELSGEPFQFFRNRIYQVDFSGATEVSGLSMLGGTTWAPVGKTLLWESTFANSNFEGLTLGPQLNNGDYSLLLVSDGDGPNDQNLLALTISGVNFVPEPTTLSLAMAGLAALCCGRRRPGVRQ